MKKCQPFGLMVAFMVLVTLCLAQEGRDEKEASSTTIDTRRSHEVVRPEDVKWGRPRRSYCRARNSRCCSGIHPNPEPRMFSGPDSRTAIAWRRIGIPWTRMLPSSAESLPSGTWRKVRRACAARFARWILRDAATWSTSL